MAPILQQLDAHWPETATSPEARRALIAWSNRHPVLLGLADLHDVLACRHKPAVAGDVSAVLASMAPTDELAARTLLQMLLPGLVAIVGSAGKGDPDAPDEIVSMAWERIRTYPATRQGSVAANVVLDVRKKYLAAQCDRRELALSDVPEPIATDPGPEEEVLAVLMVEEVADAQRDGLMTRDVLGVIMATRLGGERLSHVAAARGVKAQLLCQRRWRAERRLRDLPLAA